MFIVNVGSTYMPKEGPPAIIELVSSAFRTQPSPLEFAASDLIASFPLEIGKKDPFELKCRVSLWPGRLEFSYANLLDGDALNVVRHAASAFTATVYHPRRAAAAQCIAFCADGTQAPGCVLCESDGIVGKICC
jgi:hypothetical protein